MDVGEAANLVATPRLARSLIAGKSAPSSALVHVVSEIPQSFRTCSFADDSGVSQSQADRLTTLIKGCLHSEWVQRVNESLVKGRDHGQPELLG